MHPRTPVVWTDAPCMTVIDRSQDPIYALDYDIPYEDTEVTPDEVDQSRTHQFFAFCRDRHLEDILPGWIKESEPMEAAASGLGNLDDVDLELHVLENNPEWAGCWSRITEDAERRPITFAAADEPVLWDTMALPAGAYVVDGYTYEPWFNMWVPHPGVFKIVDDPDPAATGPAAALDYGELAVNYGDSVELTGCVDAMAGSTMTLSWAISGVGSEPDWIPFAEDLPVEGSGFAVSYEPTSQAISNTIMVRLDVTDPMDRSWTAHARSYISVQELVGDTGCDDGGNFVSNPCDTGDSDTSGGESGGGGSTDTAGDEAGTDTGPSSADGGDEGCACTSQERSPAGGLASLVLLALVGLGRRRR
jgi:uncharacterized protein (TIGR03382 family)